MKKDFVPDSVQNLYTWADNLFKQIALQGPTVGWAAGQITALQAPVGLIRDAASNVLAKQGDLDLAVGALRQTLQINLPAMRKGINNFKSSSGYHEGMGQEMGVLTTGDDKVDPNTYQPELKVAVLNGHARLTGKKRGVDSFNIYVRLKGASSWTLLAAKRVRFPYDDDSPVAHPGTAEEREYQIIGVIGDDEIGQPSNIASAVVPG